MAGEVVAVGLHLPEGPVLLPDGRLVFVEQRLGRVSQLTPTGVASFAHCGGAPNAVTLGTDGLYAAQNGGVVGAWRSADPRTPGIQRVRMDGRVEEVSSRIGNHLLRAPNDLVFGPDARLWFTDPAHGYDPVGRGHPGAVYALDRDGGGEQVADVGPVYCNGLAFDCRGQLVWVESYDRQVCRLGEDGQREVICQLPEGHIPDGLAIARDGRMFIATVTSAGITVLSPDGVVLDLIRLDEAALPTNCCFDGDALWVTDFHRDGETTPGAGRLWRVETDAVGAPLYSGHV